MQTVGTASLLSNSPGAETSPRRVEYATNTGDISEYQGPSIKQYPFRTIHMLGAAQLIVAVLIQMVAIVQISVGYGHRYVFLITASVSLWTPLPAIAAGIIGLATSAGRYWETHCLKIAFSVLSFLSGAVFMMILLIVTGIGESYYFGLSDVAQDRDVYPLPTSVIQTLEDDKDSTHKALIYSIIGLALLELIICLVSGFVTCGCAPTYKLKEKALQQKLKGAHDPEIKKVQERPDHTIPGVLYHHESALPTAINLNIKSTVQPRPPHPDDQPVYKSFISMHRGPDHTTPGVLYHHESALPKAINLDTKSTVQPRPPHPDAL